MTGTLYGIGVGPGDPELLTLKAARLLGTAPVIAYPKPENGPSLARAIAAAHLRAGAVEIAMETAYVPGRTADAVYDRYAPVIARHLDAERDVAVLCEGDPLLHGSFIYILDRLSGRYPVSVVPGVSAPTACAAQAVRPLARGDQVLRVVPATLPEAVLAAKIGADDAIALIKVGRHLDKARRVLAGLGRDGGAVLVVRASQPDARVLPLAEADTAPYFSMILVPAR